MIHAELVDFEQNKASQIQTWLNRGEFALLELAAESQCKNHQAAALNLMAKSLGDGGGNEAKIADMEFAKAARFESFVDILRKFKSGEIKPATIKLK